MKDSKFKIIIPIVLIPIILFVLLMGYIIYFKKQYKNNFADVSKVIVEKQLTEKYKEEITDIKLVGSRGDNNGSEYSWGTCYNSHFVNYYIVHSKKFNTDYIAVCEKQIFGIHTCSGCRTQGSETNVVDNLENSKRNDEKLELLKSIFNNVETEYEVKNGNFYINYVARVNANFNENNYQGLIKFKEQFKKKDGALSGIEHVFFQYNIVFNDCDLRWDNYESTFYIKDNGGLYSIEFEKNHNNDSDTNEPTKKIDEISGHTYIEENDNSLLMLHSDGTFEYYKDKDNFIDNYYKGKYDVYNGDIAIKYISEDLAQYGLTKEEQKDIFERNSKYKKDAYYCIVLKNEKCIINGENTLTDIVETPYYGFLFEDTDTLSIVNMKSANKYNFVKKY